MIEAVKFNTREKAEKCFSMLGSRAIDIFTINYNNTVTGFWVHYFKN